jgi:hypothetical protein
MFSKTKKGQKEDVTHDTNDDKTCVEHSNKPTTSLVDSSHPLGKSKSTNFQSTECDGLPNKKDNNNQKQVKI